MRMIFTLCMSERDGEGWPWPTPTKWKKKVLRALEANEAAKNDPAKSDLPRSKADLARHPAVKTTTANMTILLEGPTKSSPLVWGIHKALKWPPPSIYWSDERDLLKAEVDAGWEELTEDEREHIRSFITLSKKRKTPT